MGFEPATSWWILVETKKIIYFIKVQYYELSKMLQTKVSSSADTIKKNLRWYLNYLSNKNYKYSGNFAKTIPLHHWALI